MASGAADGLGHSLPEDFRGARMIHGRDGQGRRCFVHAATQHARSMRDGGWSWLFCCRFMLTVLVVAHFPSSLRCGVFLSMCSKRKKVRC
ncbi:hypothetical protein EJ06DRAFT_69503 [Trichodelitschia bisporula]|uniref:Uncharacterized protein n=1 Tax=Trichodelitschia bisporula TaxID=703511 RepID=A0A6G1HST1_9PEZI|nr:hypothetical protein EJ06DRAFT_69503 [Trichodelitschia bisporula]